MYHIGLYTLTWKTTRLSKKKVVDEMGVDEMGVDEMGVAETGVDEIGVDEIGVDEMGKTPPQLQVQTHGYVLYIAVVHTKMSFITLPLHTTL